MSNPANPEDDVSIGFLLVEYAGIVEQKNALNSLTNSEINVFLAAVTASGIAIGYSINVTEAQDVLFLIAFAVLSMLFALGVMIFHRVVQSRIQVFVYLRALNRIRRYFARRDRDLLPYLLLPIRDDVPRFSDIGQSTGRWTGFFSNSGMIAVINSAIGAALVASALTFERIRWWNPNWAGVAIIAVVLAAFVVVLRQHWKFQNEQMRHRERTTDVQFVANLEDA
jgi:hypothetical protein